MRARFGPGRRRIPAGNRAEAERSHRTAGAARLRSRRGSDGRIGLPKQAPRPKPKPWRTIPITNAQ